MSDERYPQPIVNFETWFSARMGEIHRAETADQIEVILHRIREYVSAKWCFAYRLSDAQSVADKIRKKNGWERQEYKRRLVREGQPV